MLMWALYASSVYSAEMSAQPCWQHPFLLAGEDALLCGKFVGLWETSCVQPSAQTLTPIICPQALCRI